MTGLFSLITAVLAISAATAVSEVPGHLARPSLKSHRLLICQEIPAADGGSLDPSQGGEASSDQTEALDQLPSAALPDAADGNEAASDPHNQQQESLPNIWVRPFQSALDKWTPPKFKLPTRGLYADGVMMDTDPRVRWRQRSSHRSLFGHERRRRSLGNVWENIHRVGKGIKSLFHHDRERKPLPGYRPVYRPESRYPPLAADLEPPPAQPYPVWPRYDPRDRGAYPGHYSNWPATTSWPWTTSTATPTPTAATPSATTTDTTTTTTTNPTTTTTAATTPSTTSRGGGVLVVSLQPDMVDGRPTCPAGFTYDAASGVCHEHCPRDASYYQSACYCDQTGFAVDFVFWRCGPAGRGR